MEEKKSSRRLSGVKRILLMASPGKGFSPGRKLKTLLTKQSSDEQEQIHTNPINDEDTYHGASDMGKETVVQIVAANHMNLLQNINPSDVEKLVNQYQQELANDTQLKPIHHFLLQRAQDMLELWVKARRRNANPPDIVKKHLPDISPEELLKLVQLLWPAFLTVINSAPAIILGEVRKLTLTHLNILQWEKAFLNIRGHIRTYEVH